MRLSWPGAVDSWVPSSTVCQVASTVPPKGDVNPYGIAVVPASVGDLTAGDVLVSNFNNTRNLQGTGTTIMQISPGRSGVGLRQPGEADE